MSVLEDIVRERRVITCVGSGGVGKTTAAASIALYGAKLGRRTLVITIDPAKRLANSMGLDELLLKPRPIADEILQKAGLPKGAECSAMMLDLQAAWDDMVTRASKSPADAQKIFRNRFYTYLSRELPGAHDFIACEALHRVASSGEYDLVVLDTPPTANALDFLDAPSRILSFLDHEAIQLFTRSQTSRLGFKFLGGALSVAQSALAKFTGAELLDELGEFLYLLRDLYEPVAERTRGFQALLRSEDTRFVAITSPQPGPAREARAFYKLLGERELPVGALVVNRLVPNPVADLAWRKRQSPAAQQAAANVFSFVQQEAEKGQLVVDNLRHDFPALPILTAKEQPADVHDIAALTKLWPDLFA